MRIRISLTKRIIILILALSIGATLSTGKATNKIMGFKYYEAFDWYVCSSVALDELYAGLNNTKKVIFNYLTIIIMLAIAM